MKSHHRLKFVWLLATLPQTIALAAQTTTSTQNIDAAHPELPPQAIVLRILQNHPDIRIKDALLRAEEAEGRRLQAGPHEWNLGLTRQQRRIQTPDPVTGATRYNEWDASLQRGIRLPGKAQTDEALAHAGIEALHWSRGETLHETSRKLLTDWFSGLREEASARAWAEQAALLDKQAQQLNRRRELGDASRLEALQATAAAAQARSQARMSRSRANAAAIELQQRYPGLTLPDVLPETTPQALTDPPELWLDGILKQDHELGTARAETRRAQLLARRVDQERLPDPTLGLMMGRERSGEERVTGLTLSIPLPGEARSTQRDAELARADAAARREAAVLQKVRAEALSQIEQARGAFEAWQASEDAARELWDAAGLAARAWQLGEGTLAESLAARRLAFEARLTAQHNRLDALEIHNRLLLDSHRLWPLDDHADETHDEKGTAEQDQPDTATTFNTFSPS
ncbi:MAG: TolC family protein [Sterolibacterium sp.]|nr:TolC family protein [Sterolibacterium sp.]MBP9714690.1 TolC family protein [Sterolibacterium sp.]